MLGWERVAEIEQGIALMELGKHELAHMSQAEVGAMIDQLKQVGFFEPVPPMADSGLRHRLMGLRERVVNVFKGHPAGAHVPALRGDAAAPKYTTLDYAGDHYDAPALGAAPAATPRQFDRVYDAPRFDMDAPRYDSLPARNYDDYNNYDAPAYYSSPGLSGGAIAGIVVGTVAVAGIVLGLAFYLKKRTRKAEQREEQAAPVVQYNV